MDLAAMAIWNDSEMEKKEAEFLISRDGLLKTIKVNFIPSTSKNMQIERIENATAAQKAVLKKWLSL